MRKLLTVLYISMICILSTAASLMAQNCSSEASQYRQAVVSLTVEKTKNVTGEVIKGSGTGFIISPDGYVLTVDHLVEQGADINDVSVSGTIGSLFAPSSKLRIVGEDPRVDVALLQFLDTSRSYQPIRLGNPWRVANGIPLCSLGFSAPLNADYRSLTGSLSSLSGQDTAHNVNNLWTTQVPSNVGESGSPVMRLPDGGVVAIKYGGERPGVAQNVNYVIPVNLAQVLLLTYTPITIPRSEIAELFSKLKERLLKVTPDAQIIPVGGWKTFEVEVVDDQGNPVPGAKVAWQTPVGGSLSYVAETNAQGIASATNLYTFGTPGSYVQSARIVGKDTPTGFTSADKIVSAGQNVLFIFQQQ